MGELRIAFIWQIRYTEAAALSSSKTADLSLNSPVPLSPHFSLIVPIYNTEALMPRCVRSILEQDFEDYELILVNDGSTDSCPALCEEYAQQSAHVRYIHQAHSGASCARNTGLQAARGTWVWFIDSDDTMHPHALRELHHLQDKQAADFYVFNEPVTALHSGNMDELLTKFHYNYLLGFPVWNKLYKRTLISTHHLSFDPTEKLGEDMLFNLEYAAHIRSCYLTGKTFYTYNAPKGSVKGHPLDGHITHMRLYEKIRLTLSGTLSPLNLRMLHFMNLECGLRHSGLAGMSLWQQTRLARAYRRSFPGNGSQYRHALGAFLSASPHFSTRRKLYWWLTLALIP